MLLHEIDGLLLVFWRPQLPPRLRKRFGPDKAGENVAGAAEGGPPLVHQPPVVRERLAACRSHRHLARLGVGKGRATAIEAAARVGEEEVEGAKRR